MTFYKPEYGWVRWKWPSRWSAARMFSGWIAAAGVTGIVIRSENDPFAAPFDGVDRMWPATYDQKSASDRRAKSINAELSNTMIRVTANKYVTSMVITGQYVFSDPICYHREQPRIRIGDDEYRYAAVALSRHMVIDQCDDMPGNDVLTTRDRETLMRGLIGMISMSPRKRKQFASIITHVSLTTDPASFLTGSEDGTVTPSNNRDRRRAATFIDHMRKTRDGLRPIMPGAIMELADRYVGMADESAELIPTAIDRSAIDTIEDAMLSLDALAFTARSTRLAGEGRRLDAALAAAMRDIELMDGEHARRGREVIDSALATEREREHVR